jgi:DNA-binding CsgD family transcriptional regulator
MRSTSGRRTNQRNITLDNYRNIIKNDKLAEPFNLEDYLKNYPFIKQLADLMPCAIYLLNYQTQEYLYVNEGCIHVTGYTAQEHMNMGNAEYIARCMHPDDANQFKSGLFSNFINEARLLSLNNIKNCRFSLNYRLKQKDGPFIKVLQQSVVLETNKEGYPLLALGALVDFTAHKLDNKMILSITCYDGHSGFKTYSTSSNDNEDTSLTKREIEILRHIIYGHTSKQIANKLNISLFTVNAHRRNIYHKTKCSNLAGLINYWLKVE